MIAEGDLQGHWRRIWIRSPGGEDRTTSVHWLQAGASFADIRVPTDLPDITGAASLAELGPRLLRAFLACEGFAGTITVENTVCTWHRRVNWHGASDRVDAGRMSFDETGGLTEEGTQAQYTELWRRAGTTPLHAFRVSGDGREGVFVTCGDTFILGLGRPQAPASAPIVAALSEGRIPDEAIELFRDVYLFGRWSGQEGTVLLSTDPFLMGVPALRRRGPALSLARQDFDGRSYEVSLALAEAGASAAQMAR